MLLQRNSTDSIVLVIQLISEGGIKALSIFKLVYYKLRSHLGLSELKICFFSFH
jgi:hypothetical protein